MKLSYDILWVDNETDIYEHHKNDIINHLEGLGFVPNIIFLNDFQEYQKNDLQLSKFDLFILDFKLKNGENGNNIVKDIREEHSIYTEIIFYSAVPEAARQQIFDDKLNGVYVSSRNFDDFEDDVLNIINVTIKKTQDVNNLRGLIMAEVAELDRIKERIITKYNSQANDDFKKYIKEKVFSKIQEELESLRCLVKIEDSDCSYDEINLKELQKNFFYDTFKKSRTIFKIKKDKCNNIDFVHEDYKKDIIEKRNVLAHQEEKPRNDGVKILKYPNGNDLEFTEKHCIQIRKDVKKYKKLLEEIEKAI